MSNAATVLAALKNGQPSFGSTDVQSLADEIELLRGLLKEAGRDVDRMRIEVKQLRENIGARHLEIWKLKNRAVQNEVQKAIAQIERGDYEEITYTDEQSKEG